VSTGAPRLAVFDLDGTLTRRDTFGPFLQACLARWPLRAARVPLLLGSLAAFAGGTHDRGAFKGGVMHALLGGLDRDALGEAAQAHARDVVRRGLHVEAMEVLAAHRAAGDRLVLMSASPDLYVPLVGRELGFDEVHCTEVRWNGERLDGRLAGANCRDIEKSRRLAALRERHPGMAVIGYGNSGADLDHLRRCESAVYVNAPSRDRAGLEAMGLRLVQWH
jgi:phosphatidylglycerophosphatase C